MGRMSSDVVSGLATALSVDRVKEDVLRITQDIPSRLAGSENGRRMAEYSAARFWDAGLAAQVHEMPGLVSFPEKTSLRILAPTELTIDANTLGHSAPTLAEGISGTLVDVRSGDFSDYEGQDATGKITLSELSYNPARHEKQRISALKGAIGCVMMNWGPPDNAALPFGSVKPAWGNPTPEAYRNEMATLPCIGIARSAGLKLREMLQQGPVEVAFRANVENGWRPVQITVAEIAAPASQDFVLVGGHQDSWPGPQATDNAAGNACILELARVFNERRDQLRRGVVFGLWTGHETGTMIGSSWFADREWSRLRKHAVAYVQIDQPACAGTTNWVTYSNVELRRFHQEIEARELGGREYHQKHATKSGDASFFGLGVPMLAGHGIYTKQELEDTAFATLGWWHHSIENTIDKLDWDYMDAHLRVYAGWLWDLCTVVVLPYEFESVAAQFVERLSSLGAAGDSVGLGDALTWAEAFEDAARRLAKLSEELRLRYAKGETNFEPADQVNACFKRLSRMLMPLASTIIGSYGHDPYGHTAQAEMIPRLWGLEALAGLPPDSEERWMIEVKFVRERNRLVDTFSDAVDLIDDTIRRVR